MAGIIRNFCGVLKVDSEREAYTYNKNSRLFLRFLVELTINLAHNFQ